VDDDDFETDVMTIKPQRHNRWAVIVPALDLISNVALDVHQTFKLYGIMGAQHSMQKQYDRKFKEIIK
jgi:hypothetical protein